MSHTSSRVPFVPVRVASSSMDARRRAAQLQQSIRVEIAIRHCVNAR